MARSARQNKILELISEKAIERQEDLEFTMGAAKSGFCINYEESSDRILKDLKYMYDCIKAKL